MDYSKRPGEKRESRGILKKKEAPVISIVTPFYNGGSTIMEAAISVFNQTYPFFEWIIVDDGSKDSSSLMALEKVSKMDDRVCVYHQDNAGPAVARDFGISKTSSSTKYVLFLDCDDLFDKTMLECLYWTLQTHPDASFAYTSMVNFGDKEFLWEKYLTVEQEIRENLICTSSMVRKSDLLEVGGFGIKEKSMYEDWNLWLKLLAAGKKPVRVSSYLFWYRQTLGESEFSRAKSNHAKAMKYVNQTARSIQHDVDIIQFPREGDSYATVKDYEMVLPQYQKNKKIKLLFLFPWMVVGGADYFNLAVLKGLDPKKYESIILTTIPSENALRQEFEQYASEIYDLAGFLDRIDYLAFTDYIMASRNIDMVVVSNTQYGYYMVPYLKAKYPKVPFIDYIHSVDLRDERGSFGRYSRDIDPYLTKTYCCNDFTKRQLAHTFGKSNVETLYIGTDDQKYDPSKFEKASMREKYGIPTKKVVISFIARLSAEKRPLMFVEIAKRLLEEGHDYFFVIAGDGPLMEEVAASISDCESIQALGMVSTTEEIYALSDLTVNCSSLEGLALTSYESLAMGVPVVSSDVGGQTELIDEKVGGVVCYHESPTDEIYQQEIEDYCAKIQQVLLGLDKIKKNCRKRIQQAFSVSLMVEHFEDIILKSIKEEKNAVKTFYDGTLIFELAMEIFHFEYYFICKDYLERKFGILHTQEKMLPKEEIVINAKKIQLMEMLSRHNARGDATALGDVLRSMRRLLREGKAFIKCILLAIPAFFKLIYKLIFVRNS